MKLTIERIEALHPEVARALRARSGMERLRVAHDEWELTRDRIALYLAAQHPAWSRREIQQEVARRLLDDSSRAASPPR